MRIMDKRFKTDAPLISSLVTLIPRASNFMNLFGRKIVAFIFQKISSYDHAMKFIWGIQVKTGLMMKFLVNTHKTN